MYNKSQLDLNLSYADVFDFSGGDLRFQSGFASNNFHTSTALSAQSAVFLFWPIQGPLEGNPLEATSAQTALSQFSGHLQNLETKVEVVLEGVILARETAEAIQDGLGIFEEIEKAADTVADVMGGFRTVLKLVGKVGFLKPLANKLDGAMKQLIEAVRDVESRAARIDDKLDDEKELVDDLVDDLSGYEDGIDLALSRIISLRTSVDQADAAFSRLQDDGGSAGGNADLELAVENLLFGSNVNFSGLDQYLSDVTFDLAAIDSIFGNIADILPGATTIKNQLAAIAAELSFLQTPMNVLNDALSPVEWVLDAVDFVFNTIVAPILNPILDAFGITALFDEISNELLSLLPDTDAIFNIEGRFDTIFSTVNVDFLSDFIDGLDLPNFELNLDSFLDPVGTSTSSLIVLEAGELTAIGSASDDLISGNDLSNTLSGAAGDDVFTPGQGNDIVNGGSGEDTVIFDAALTEFSITQLTNGDLVIAHIAPAAGQPNFGTNTLNSVEHFVFSDTVGDPLTEATLINIDNVPLGTTGTYQGTTNNDFIIGNTEANSIDGALGNDFINGGLGDDTLLGGDGDDILAGGGGSDIIDGGAGFDIASFAGLTGPVNFVLLPTALRGGLTLPGALIENITNIERFIGSDGSDRFFGDFGDNQFDGAGGNDVLRGLDGDDILMGDDGDDFLFGDLGNDTLDGGSGNDFLTSGSGDDTLDGGAGIDTLYYGGPTSPSSPEAGSPGMGPVLTELNYRAEAAIFSGVIDHIIYDGVAETVIKYDSLGTVVGTDNFTNIERIYGGDGDDLFTGSLAAEIVVGGNGNDIIRLNGASDGEDAFFGGGGDDIIYLSGTGSERGNGGSGSNQFIYENAGELTQDYTLFINETGGTDDTVDFSASQYGLTNRRNGQLSEMNTLTFDTTSDVTVTMEINGIETLIGTAFADRLEFGINEDRELWLSTDTFYAGDGDDYAQTSVSVAMTLYGEGGDDTLTLSGAGGALYGGAGNDVLGFFADGEGGEFPSSILDGGDGNDLIFTRLGEHTIIGGDGIDTVSFSQVGQLPVIIDLGNPAGTSISFPIPGSATMGSLSQTITGVENAIGGRIGGSIFGSDQGAAQSGDNLLIGLNGNDLIDGRSGDDLIFGGQGDDTLNGGAGDDILFLGGGSIIFFGDEIFGDHDIADGGTGSDTLSFEYAAELRSDATLIFGPLFSPDDLGYEGSVTVDLHAGTSSFDVRLGNTIHTGTFTNIENVTGTALNDTLRGDNNALVGNRLIGGLGDDQIWGFDGDDNLIGGEGDDSVYGGNGDDLIIAGRGTDRVFGGLGQDTIIGSGADQGLTLDLTAGTATFSSTIETPVWADTQGIDARAFTYDPGLEGGGTVTLMLTPEQIFRTREENIQTREDLDLYFNDNFIQQLNQLNSGTTDVNDVYTPGIFEISFTESTDISTTTFSGIENAQGGIGNDSLTGNNLDNILAGGGGNDSLFGGLGNDRLNGGFGDDVIYGDTGSVIANFGFANLNIDGSTILSDGTSTGSQTDYLAAGNLTGFDGTSLTIEILYQSSEENDAPYYFSYATENNNNEIVLLENDGQFRILIGDTATNTGGLSTDIVEDGALHRISLTYELLQSGDGVITLYVDGVEIYTRTTANRAIEAGGTLVFGQHQDVVGGGFDTDQILSGSVGDIRLWDSVRSQNEITADAFNLADATDGNLLENWVFDDGISNRAGTQTLFQTGGFLTSIGTAGNDVIDGGAGDDWLFGEAGDDLFLSSLEDSDSAEEDLNNLIDTHDGADVFDGGAGFDTVSYENSSVGVTVNLGSGTGAGGDAAGDSYISIESAVGSEFNDTFISQDSGNTFLGLGGVDRFVDGAGADTYDGGAGFDIVSYAGAASGVFVSLFTGTGNIGDAAGDSLIDIEALQGSGFNDILVGRDGASDTLLGGQGSDGLRGNGGDDMLFGEGGNDLFFSGFGADFHNGGSGTDTILYNQAGAGVIVNLTSGTGSIGQAAGDTYVSIENVVGTAFADYIVGSAGANNLQGRAGNDVLDGRAGADVLIGGNNADRFVFDAGYGTDRIEDFTSVDGDIIDVRGFGFTSFAQVQALMFSSGGDTVINFGGGDALRLVGVDINSLSASDFLLSGGPNTKSAEESATFNDEIFVAEDPLAVFLSQDAIYDGFVQMNEAGLLEIAMNEDYDWDGLFA